MEASISTRQRIASIDIVRGLVMVLMALDHTRDYFHFGVLSLHLDPLDAATTTPWLFTTRWITHLCAPAFVLLTGIGGFLYTQKLGVNGLQASWYFISRGLWLILLENTLIIFGWTFSPYYENFFLQVIWAIGFSMVMLGFIFGLPRSVLLFIALLIIGCHNLFDNVIFEKDSTKAYLWAILHQGGPIPLGDRLAFVVYPALPWFGIMLLGYCMGPLFTTATHQKRAIVLFWAGLGGIALFIGLRFLGLYGDPNPWVMDQEASTSIYTFFDVDKYPPSLLYTLVTIGITCWLLLLFEWIRLPGLHVLKVYGTVPLFYYAVHIYLIHGLNILAFFIGGGNLSDLDTSQGFRGYPDSFGFGLPVVYAVWIFVVVVLYPICVWFARVKSRNKSAWWVSYV